MGAQPPLSSCGAPCTAIDAHDLGNRRQERTSGQSAGPARALKIHIYSRCFAPSIGGLERLIETLAAEFHRAGHSVTLSTESEGHADVPYPVYRRPEARRFLSLCREADVILSAPLSLRRLPMQLISGRPICVVHPAIMKSYTMRQHLAVRIKWFASRFLTNIVPSRFVAEAYRASVTIPNPFDEETFRFPPVGTKRKDILFAGRFAPSKGCALLVESFAKVVQARPQARLTIVGGGPEEAAIRERIAALGLAAQIRISGAQHAQALAATMQHHAIMVVPSVIEEAFGIVALEGLASGCRMVVANAGGLPEAVGPHATYFERGDAESLATALTGVIDDYAPPDREVVERYLDRFRPSVIADAYLAVMAARTGHTEPASIIVGER